MFCSLLNNIPVLLRFKLKVMAMNLLLNYQDQWFVTRKIYIRIHLLKYSHALCIFRTLQGKESSAYICRNYYETCYTLNGASLAKRFTDEK